MKLPDFQPLFSEYLKSADYLAWRLPDGIRVGLMIDSSDSGQFVLSSRLNPEHEYIPITPPWASAQAGVTVLRRLHGFCRRLPSGSPLDITEGFAETVRSTPMYRAARINPISADLERLVYHPFLEWGMERLERNPARIIIWDVCHWEIEIRAYGSFSFGQPGPRHTALCCKRHWEFPKALAALALSHDRNHS